MPIIYSAPQQQPPTPILDNLKLSEIMLGRFAQTFVKAYNDFWEDPIVNAPKVNAETHLYYEGFTAQQLWADHAVTAQFLATVAPQLLSGLAAYPPPVTVTFTADGAIDIPALEAALQE